MQDIKRSIHRIYIRIGLRTVIWVSFTATAVLAALLMGLSFYSRISAQVKNRAIEEKLSLIEQVNNTLSSHVRSMMRVSDTLYYSVIKNTDLRSDRASNQFLILYDSNRDFIENIALFNSEGNLLAATPPAMQKTNVAVTNQDWFRIAQERTENLHFIGPRVQNIFANKEEPYSWVISLSRAVQFTYGTEIEQGVLLLDLRYTGIEEIFKGVKFARNEYFYLIDDEGEIIYHPKHQQIASGLYKENHYQAATYRDGYYEEEFNNQSRMITVKTVGYIGWRIIGVSPLESISLNSLKSNIFYAFLTLFFITVMMLINSFISARVANPIRKMEQSVRLVEAGNLHTPIPVDGCMEVHHLGHAIRNMTAHIRKLMQDIVDEEASKRKRELETLQSQINPHFLYNTLDIIVWMVQNEQRLDAVRTVTALGRFFRISLSGGASIISISDELDHANSYLTIQNMRYKDRFEYRIEAEEGVKSFSIIKLVLQPLIENAIYHGMEFMDGDGEIVIVAKRVGKNVHLIIEDNGPGMRPEISQKLLERERTPSKRGSGIGVKNVHERIQLQFGEPYGLKVESEPDIGTKITICIPAIPYKKGDEI